jgi:hypothetical protein
VAELLLAEHSPTNAAEFLRMRQHERGRHDRKAAAADGGSSGVSDAFVSRVQFVYDCPDLTQWEIFGAVPADGGLPQLDKDNARRADEHEVDTARTHRAGRTHTRGHTRIHIHTQRHIHTLARTHTRSLRRIHTRQKRARVLCDACCVMRAV